jgi:6-pyruvoyltetrahydropterin/6-carboxytetrahydropterin synthase
MKRCIARTFYFEAAHFLPDYEGSCREMHGHSYVLCVTIRGDFGGKMVMDYGTLKKIVNKHVIDRLDHSVLNDFIEYPTAEEICGWIWYILVDKFKVYEVELVKILVKETRDTECYISIND